MTKALPIVCITRLVTVPDCGHASTLERPRHLTEALLELLRG